MKRVLLIAIFLIPMLIISYGTSYAEGFVKIKGKRLEQMLKDPQKEILIDVREQKLFYASHIPGAINIEFEDAKKKGLNDLPKNKNARIVFICHGGPMGDTLAYKLTKQGYTNVFNLSGGMRQWEGPLVLNR